MGQVNLDDINDWEREDGGLGLIRKLMDYGAIPKEGTFKCPRGHLYKLSQDRGNIKWRCGVQYSLAKAKKRRCEYTASIRTGTFFENSKLSIVQICKFINLWVDNVELRVIKKQCRFGSQNTGVDWSSFCREVVLDYMIDRQEKIGGPGKTVELDETKIGKRKYNRGKRVEGQWVFGGVERESGKCFMMTVEKRDRATLLPIIKDWILPGSTIISDCWKSYDTLNQEGYTHLTVNHSKNFKDPITGACSNAIEGTWSALKRSINPSGRRKLFFNGYLSKYVFRRLCRRNQLDPFVEFLKAAGLLYNPVQGGVEQESEDGGEEQENEEEQEDDEDEEED